MAKAKKPRQRAVTVKDALKLVGLSDLTCSPEGEQVAFVRSEATAKQKKRETSVWVVSARGARLRQLTQGPRDGQPAWSPDGQSLAFVRQTEEGTPAQIFLMPRHGGEARQLRELDESPEALRFTPNGRRVSFLALTPYDPATRKRRDAGDDASVFVDDERHKRLWTVSTGGGRPRACSPGDKTVWEYAWLPDGQRAAVIYTDTAKVDDLYFSPRLGIADCARGTIARLDVSFSAATGLRVSPDGRHAAVVAGEPPAPFGFDAWALNLESGEATCLTPGLNGSVYGLEWLPDAPGLALIVGRGLRTTVCTVPLNAPGQFKPTCASLPPALDGLALAPVGKALFTLAQGPDEAPEIWRCDLQNCTAGKLTEDNRFVSRLKLAPSAGVKWPSTEQLEIDGTLTLPPDFRKGEPRPTILRIHGGPAGRFREELALWPRQVLAARGYVVLAPNPRGSSGYGTDFLKANYADWGGGDFRDLMAGLDALVDQGVADPERLGVYGASYGGYLTAWTATQTDRFKAAVCQCGLTDLFSFHSQTDITPNFMERYFGVSPYEDPELYRAHSAMSFVKQVTTPTLFLHGERDVRVPAPQSHEMYWALRHFGVPTELVIYPREGHGIEEPLHQRDLYGRVLAWFDRYLGPSGEEAK